MRNWGMVNWGMEYFFFLSIGIWKLHEYSLFVTPLISQVFRPMTCDNPCPTHCPGDNLGNVADEYSRTQPAVVGDHTPLSAAAGASRSTILSHAELKTPSLQGTTVRPSSSYAPPPTWACPTPAPPNRGWGHITAGFQISLQFLASWEAWLFLQLPQSGVQKLYPPPAKTTWKDAGLCGKAKPMSNKCQIHMGKELVPVSGAIVSHTHNWNVRKLVQPCREARDTPSWLCLKQVRTKHLTLKENPLL